MGIQSGTAALENSGAVSDYPAIPLLGVCLIEMKTYVHTETHTRMFILAFFIIAKDGNNPSVLQRVNMCTNLGTTS